MPGDMDGDMEQDGEGQQMEGDMDGQ